MKNPFKKVNKPLPPLEESPYKKNPDAYLVNKGIVDYPLSKVGRYATNLIKTKP